MAYRRSHLSHSAEPGITRAAEVQARGVEAVAEAGGRGAVVEDVAEVGAARRQTTSIRPTQRLWSTSDPTAPFPIGSQKLGQPVPESNFVAEANSGAPQHTQR